VRGATACWEGATACWDCASDRKHSEPPRAGALFLLSIRSSIDWPMYIAAGPDSSCVRLRQSTRLVVRRLPNSSQ
jgi:hypothetical protein